MDRERAPLIPDVGLYNNPRMRCTWCDKVAYKSEEEARYAAKVISKRQPMEAYYDKKCGWWHLTRTTRKR